MNELNKKLAEFVWGKDNVKLLWGCTDECGHFMPVPPDYEKTEHDTEQRLCFPNSSESKGGTSFAWWEEVPNFPNDLNACFKWLVPKRRIVSVTFRYYPVGVYCEITVLGEDRFTSYKGCVDVTSEKEAIEKSAAAFCKAVEILMEKE